MAWLEGKSGSASSPEQSASNSDVDPGEVVSLDDLARQAGPFSPPRDYAFEPELSGPPPRAVPPDCRRAPAAMQLRRNGISCLLIGLACIAFSRAHFVQDLSYYLLPLGYLSYIGAGLSALGAVMLGSLYLPGGPMSAPFKYIKRGEAVVARVLHKRHYIKKVKTHGTTILNFGFETGVQVLHPEKGRAENLWVRSDEIGTYDKAKRFREPFEVGDEVTLVYFPGRFDKTARIYSLLGVSATAPYIEKDGKPWERGVSFTMALVITGLAISAIGLFISGLYAMEFRSPIEDSGSALFRRLIPAAIILGPLAGLGMWKLLSINQKRGNSQVRLTWLWVLLASVVGGMLGGYLCVTFVNSGLDRSPPEYREFEVVNFWEETHDAIFRTYEIEYQPLHGGKTQKYPAKHEEMKPFFASMAGVAEVHRGYLGLPWVRRLYPMRFELTRELSSQPAAGKELEELFEIVATADRGKRVPASPELVRRIMAKMAAREKEVAVEDESAASAPARSTKRTP